MSRLYRYQGPQSIAQAVAGHPEGSPIRSMTDLEQWIHNTNQQVKNWGTIAATFVITQEGLLSLADRHSEHVACAGGKAVRSAGESFFARSQAGWAVCEVSNQSTGYCPEPASWLEVAAALEQIPLPHPGSFTHVVQFRRCPVCRQLNLIKEEVFVCVLCDAELPLEWNLENSEEMETVSSSLTAVRTKSEPETQGTHLLSLLVVLTLSVHKTRDGIPWSVAPCRGRCIP